MKLSEFDYKLPPELIAQIPATPRDSARLLVMDKDNGHLEDKVFSDIADMLWENDVLVVNETKVIKARLKGNILWIEKACEIFLHTQLTNTSWDCLVYPGKKLKPGTKITFMGTDLTWTILDISHSGRIVEFSHWGNDFFKKIELCWEMPLPPYIKQNSSDESRYQTVYNDPEKSWSVAAPTAGLHFTAELLKKLEIKWVKIEKICLHVWLWTFLNVETDNIEDHAMHSEKIFIAEDVSHRLNTYKNEWRRIIAVGTTSVRTLESFTDQNGHLWHGSLDTEIFIYPGYNWKFVDSIITNFHLPKSTLIMLVSSFAWYEHTMHAYKYAVAHNYRFFSFWDAMWIR